MTLLKPLLLATMLSIASNAAKTDCPLGWLPNTFHETKCCSGNMVIDEQGAYCCVNDMRAYKELLTNTALLYATSTTTEETNWSTVDNSCFAEVSSASSKAEATPTNDSTSKATSTSTTTSGATAGTGSQTSTSSPTSSPTPTSNAAMPLATADVLGGAAFAAALFML
ncbi:unnamed protein product [Penicillium crustosum]